MPQAHLICVIRHSDRLGCLRLGCFEGKDFNRKTKKTTALLKVFFIHL